MRRPNAAAAEAPRVDPQGESVDVAVAGPLSVLLVPAADRSGEAPVGDATITEGSVAAEALGGRQSALPSLAGLTENGWKCCRCKASHKNRPKRKNCKRCAARKPRPQPPLPASSQP